MNNIISGIKQFCSSKLGKAVIVILTGLVILALILLLATRPSDNKPLTSDERKIQTAIQQDTKNNAIRYDETKIATKKNGEETTTLQDGDWRLVQVNTTESPNYYASAIMDGDKVVIQPTTDFDLAELVDKGVPEKIIDYLFPDKPQWGIHDADKFDSIFAYDKDTVKYLVQNFSVTKYGQVDRILTTSGSITQKIENARDANRTEVAEFKFTANNQAEVFTFRRRYAANSSEQTYEILDADGNVLASSTSAL